jgi:hypothetical protein
MTTHSDEFIEHWAEVFREGRVKTLLDIDFETFLEDPKAWCAAAACVSRVQAGAFEPLLPEQQAVSNEVLAEDITAALKRMNDGLTLSSDQVLIEAALGQSLTGRRMLAQRGMHVEYQDPHRPIDKSAEATLPVRRVS